MLAAASAFTASAVARHGQTEPLAAEDMPARTGLGLVEYCLGVRRRATKPKGASADLSDPLTFLDVCHGLGAGGMQMSLGVGDEASCEALRQKAEQYGMYIEGIISPPHTEGDVERFERQVETAARVGVKAVRTVIIPGRRYEFFGSLDKFHQFDARGRRSLELAAPVVEKYRVPLAVENHKDHRIEQRVALLRHIDSQYVGACIDTGNNLALLEDPVDLARALAPWAKSVHLKDQSVREYEDGFLLGDVPLGQGCIDLKTIVTMIRNRCEDVRFSLELITRDALQVPCLTEKYWSTLWDVPASDLAGTLALVRRCPADNLQHVSDLSPAEQVALEAANLRHSLAYARDTLEI
jgi:sugar phosphate isomerase/epimerase